MSQDKLMERPSDIDDIDDWPKLLGYAVPEGATLEEKLYLRRQHAEAMVGQAEAHRSRIRSFSDFTGLIADVLGNINAKTEGRVLQLQSDIGAVLEALDEGADPELVKSKVRDLVGDLQFQDIQRQELEATQEALQGVGEFVASALEAPSDAFADALEMLPDALEALLPRTDIDAQDVEDSGPKIELF